MKIALTPGFLAICLLASTAVDASPIPSQLGTDLVPRHASPSPSDMFSLFVRDSKLYKSALQDGHGDDGLQKRSEEEANFFRDKLKELEDVVVEAAALVRQKSDPTKERLDALKAYVVKLESMRNSVRSMLQEAPVVDDMGKWDKVNLISDKYPENVAVWKEREEKVDWTIALLNCDIGELNGKLDWG
ncbi:hypothetical protein H0H93_011210 [Arthromyces matolae]|nr:hypothetical protein H0H93_011210 [Arthromyces matolae]